jgi:L-threonylcarbamoyladenylate synthase
MQSFNAEHLSARDCDEILSCLRNGGVIGYPTDTAYGLGADPSNDAAVRRIFEIKGRPETKPILLVVDSIQMVQTVASIPESFHRLAERFWPGPLTLVLPAASSVSNTLTAGTDTIGIRWPLAAFANRIVTALGRPLTATSANRSGTPSAVSAENVRSQFGTSLDILVDGGLLTHPGGSTILDLTHPRPLLLRAGPVSVQELNTLLNGQMDVASGITPAGTR